MTGLDRVARAFAHSRPALMPYYTLGYPDIPTSLDVVVAISKSGADLIELGIPFSDPLADGPTIQHSTQIALESGTTVGKCLDMVAELRRRAVGQPLLFMSYFNPVLAYGLNRFVTDAATAGIDGLILPDVPLEEADEVAPAARGAGLAMPQFVAPTSTPERIQRAAELATGFLYLVSVLGTTGARRELPPGLPDFAARVREATGLPRAVGFGVGTPQQARDVGRLVEGVIVGSAVIRSAEAERPAASVVEFVKSLRDSLRQSRT